MTAQHITLANGVRLRIEVAQRHRIAFGARIEPSPELLEMVRESDALDRRDREARPTGPDDPDQWRSIGEIAKGMVP